MKKKIIEQLALWNLFKPIDDPNREIYSLYKKLSADVHVIPGRTDIGRKVLTKSSKMFESPVVMEVYLREYLHSLEEVIDVGLIIMLNLFEDSMSCPEVKADLTNIMNHPRFQGLRLKHVPQKIKEVVEVV